MHVLHSSPKWLYLMVAASDQLKPYGRASMSEQPFFPVAQYLRMSTTNQRYSLENQRDALALYARDHGMTIVQTYSDPGCSGLELKHRLGLRQLLQDVVSKSAFRAIIVYDVSRWGRFQDPDEAAHYEFLCKSAGVPVHYSSEQFVNDGQVLHLG
jgi:DNA invertase Pin-like site-specific DNA recombinase